MRELRKVYRYNIIAYLSFLLYLLLGMIKQIEKYKAYYMILPIVAFLMTLCIFNTHRNKSLVIVRPYGIFDFCIRGLGLGVCHMGNRYCHTRLGLTAELVVLIVLFATNLTFEKIMSIRMNRYIAKLKKVGRPPEGECQVMISIGTSYIETIILLFMLLMPFNLHKGQGFSAYIIWGSVLSVLLLIYIRQTLVTLYGFYKKEKEVRGHFITENVSIGVLLLGLSVFGYYYGFSTIADGVFYMTAMLALIPRQVARNERLREHNETRGSRHIRIRPYIQ